MRSKTRPGSDTGTKSSTTTSRTKYHTKKDLELDHKITIGKSECCTAGDVTARGRPNGGLSQAVQRFEGSGNELGSLCGLYGVCRGRQDGDKRAVALGECRVGAFSRSHRNGQGSVWLRKRRLKRYESVRKAIPGAAVRCTPKRESSLSWNRSWHQAAARAGGARACSSAAVKRSTMRKRPPQRGQTQPLRAGSQSE